MNRSAFAASSAVNNRMKKGPLPAAIAIILAVVLQTHSIAVFTA